MRGFQFITEDEARVELSTHNKKVVLEVQTIGYDKGWITFQKWFTVSDALALKDALDGLMEEIEMEEEASENTVTSNGEGDSDGSPKVSEEDEISSPS